MIRAGIVTSALGAFSADPIAVPVAAHVPLGTEIPEFAQRRFPLGLLCASVAADFLGDRGRVFPDE